MNTPYTRGAWILAFALAPWGTQARELTPVDALANAPIVARVKGSVALPDGVDRWSREERLGLPSFVWMKPASAAATTKFAVQAAPAAARAVLQQLAPAYGLSAQEVAAAPVHHRQTLASGAQLVRFSNRKDGIEVFREQATVLLNAKSQATAIGGYLGSTKLAPQTKAAQSQALDMQGAIARALQDWGFDTGVAPQLEATAPPMQGDPGPYQWWALPAGVAGADGATLPEPVRGKPVWFRLPQGLVAAYYLELQVQEAGKEHGWSYVVAKDDGRLLLRNNQTVHASEFGYRVFADPATLTPWPGAQGRNGTPHPTGVPDGYAAPLEAPNLVNLSSLPSTVFSRGDPWLAPGATQTIGNNVHAFANLRVPDGLNAEDESQCGDNLSLDFRACTTAPGQFDYGYDHAQGPLASKAQAATSVVNLFYVTNWLHDWFYDAGFDEAAGNAQASNLGRGGLSGDALVVQALDFDGTNNANMLTRADGAPSRMRMYRYTNAAPVQTTVLAPTAIAGSYAVGKASFGPQAYDVSGDVVAAQDGSRNPSYACEPITTAVRDKIALVDRGICAFTVKVMNAQLAGARAVVVVDNVPGAVGGMTGADPSITIPAIRLSQADGAVWKTRLTAGDTVNLRMQSNVAIDRSSALDNGIIAHEWGHFISNRLIGDANGLSPNHASGLGEGWGDFHALLMMVTAADRHLPGNGEYQGAYTAGSYSMAPVIGPGVDSGDSALFGIRRYPYSTDTAKNPLTLKHIADNEPLPSTAPRNLSVGGANAEVHNMGEVWANMLWACYAGLLNAHPDFADAQGRMKRALVAGYKLTPVNPTLVEARDALLAAVAAGDPADYSHCAAGFAKRGAGPLALVPDRFSTNNNGVVEDFGTSSVLEWVGLTLSMSAPQAQRCDADAVLDSGETGVLMLTLHNRGFSEAVGAQLTLSADVANLQFPDGMLTVPSVPAGGSVNLAARVQLSGLMVPGAARITASLTQPGLPAALRTLDVPLHRDLIPNRLATDDAEAEPSAMTFGSTLTAYADAWAVKIAATPQYNRFYAGSAPPAAGSHWMRTPTLQVAASGGSTVSFKHRHRFEQDSGSSYDGGQLMVSVDGGVTWTTVANTGYNGTLFTGVNNPHEGEHAYVGQSANWPAMQAQTVDLSTYAGHAVRLAWVVHTDASGTDEGWEVDDIVFTGLDNTPFAQVVADAQWCAPLLAEGGGSQSAKVGAAFAQPLRVKLLDAAGVAMVGEEVTFSAPASGASAVFAGGLVQVTALTDANGVAQSLALTANATAGSYSVAATRGAQSLAFALTNTADNGGGNGGNGGGNGGGTTPAVLSFSGPSPLGQGMVTAAVQSALQALPNTARFTSGSIVSAGTVPALDGYRFPFGLAEFVLQDVGVRNTVTMRLQYPTAVPVSAEYWKWGRTTAGGALHWYQIPMKVINANTVEIELTDGGTGDSDALDDGVITDPGGVAVPVGAVMPTGAAMPVPALSAAALAMLTLLMAGMGLQRRRR